MAVDPPAPKTTWIFGVYDFLDRFGFPLRIPGTGTRPDKIQFKKGIRSVWNAAAQIMELTLLVDPDAESSLGLSGSEATADTAYLRLEPNHSYVIRYEVVARTSFGSLLMSEVTVTAYRLSAGPAQIEMSLETRKLYTDEITVAVLQGDSAAEPGHDYDIFARVSQTTGSKSIEVRAYIESSAVISV